MDLRYPVALVALCLTSAVAARAQTNAAARDQVHLSIQVRNWTPAARVRITFLQGPDSLRDVVRDVATPFGLTLPARTALKVRIEPMAGAHVTTVQVQVLRGTALLSEGSITGASTVVSVNRGTISLTSVAPGWKVWPAL